MNQSFIVARLLQWADWSNRRMDSGQGYPKQVPYTNLMPRSGMCAGTPEFDDDCFDIEKCVIALAATRPDLHLVIELCYRKQMMTVDQKLGVMGCSKGTYYNRLEEANNKVLAFLVGLDAGDVLPVPSSLKRTA